MIHVRYVLACLTAVVAVSALADDATTKPAIAAAPADAKADTLTGAVDPYDAADQKVKFLRAAGRSNELDAKAFETDRKAGGGVVMPFEKWETAIAFDENKNGKLDWFEFVEYRKAMRKAALAACDKNKDDKLTGDERVEALKLLTAGKLVIKPEAAAGRAGAWSPRVGAAEGERAQGEASKDGDEAAGATSQPASGAGSASLPPTWPPIPGGSDAPVVSIMMITPTGSFLLSPSSVTMLSPAANISMPHPRSEIVEKYRKDGGKLSDEDRQAMWQELGKEFEERITMANVEGGSPEFVEKLKRQLHSRFDKNGDGTLNDNERQAMWQELGQEYEKLIRMAENWKDSQEEWRKLRAETEKERLRRFDKDGDGELNKEEQAEADRVSTWEGWPESYQEFALRHFDTDGDGKLDEKEMQAAADFQWELIVAGADNMVALVAGLGKDASPELIEEAGNRLWPVRANVEKALWKHVDPDGTDSPSFAKQELLYEKLMNGMACYGLRYEKQALADNGGQPGEAVRTAMRKAIDADLRQRIKKADVKNKGYLDFDEIEKYYIDLQNEYLKASGK